jgi:benzoyl-CoA reductase/2-hydroxyglutaryl-CoA dehydratase subunit BcrC/BadD/HgdB
MYWEGVPIWCALRPLASLFLDQGIAVVGSSYGHTYAALQTLQRDNPIESMAAAYTAIYPNRSREAKVRYLKREFARYGVDGAAYHDARTSPAHSTVRYGVHIRLRRDTGVQPLVIEADTHDLRLVSMEQIKSQLQEFLEQRRARLSRPPAGATANGNGHERSVY